MTTQKLTEAELEKNRQWQDRVDSQPRTALEVAIGRDLEHDDHHPIKRI